MVNPPISTIPNDAVTLTHPELPVAPPEPEQLVEVRIVPASMSAGVSYRVFDLGIVDGLRGALRG